MVNIVYACNDAYVRQTIISMVSVIEHNPDTKLYLIGDQIGNENQQMIQEILGQFGQQVHLLELDQVLPQIDLDEADRHPRTIYAKLFLGDVIKDDRVLYLDSDVIIGDSLEPLFSREMEGKTAGGVLMPYSSKVKARNNCEAGEPYICDGVVLFNLELWRKERKAAACVDYIRQQEGKPPMLSEGTLNHVCRNEILVLEPGYNLMPSMLMYSLDQIRTLFRADCYYENQKEIDEARQKPAAIHFMNELYNRPWFEPCDHPMKDYYLKMEKKAFGVNQAENMALSVHTARTVWLKRHMPFSVFAALYHWKNRV